MKKRSLIASLALMLIVPYGLNVAGSGPASAEGSTCYVDGPDGGLEEAPNFTDQGSCESVVHGYWL